MPQALRRPLAARRLTAPRRAFAGGEVVVAIRAVDLQLLGGDTGSRTSRTTWCPSPPRSRTRSQGTAGTPPAVPQELAAGARSPLNRLLVSPPSPSHRWSRSASCGWWAGDRASWLQRFGSIDPQSHRARSNTPGEQRAEDPDRPHRRHYGTAAVVRGGGVDGRRRRPHWAAFQVVRKTLRPRRHSPVMRSLTAVQANTPRWIGSPNSKGAGQAAQHRPARDPTLRRIPIAIEG